jgi:hypothetical protein
MFFVSGRVAATVAVVDGQRWVVHDQLRWRRGGGASKASRLPGVLT